MFFGISDLPDPEAFVNSCAAASRDEETQHTVLLFHLGSLKDQRDSPLTLVKMIPKF